jgi:hypothetical protein
VEDKVDNTFVQSAIEEALEEALPVSRFERFLVEVLTSAITYKRGVAPEEVAILNDPEMLKQIQAEYAKQFEAKK